MPIAGAWAWATHVLLDPLEGNPSGMLLVDPELAAPDWRVANWWQNDCAGLRNRIAALLTTVAVVLSSSASLLSRAPKG